MKRFALRSTCLVAALLISSATILAADYDQHWAKEAITKWNAYEVVKGYENGDFRPNNPITRAELATILDRIFKFPETTSPSPYMDLIATPDKWYVAPINKVTAQNLMYIEGFLFEPNAPVTREEAAYAIAKAYELAPVAEEKTYFKDQNQISVWAKESVNTLAAYGYISGTPEGNFLPKSTLTRAEVVTMLNNITPTLLTKMQPFTQSVKGNVVVNSQEAVLKNLTIEGNLYLTSGVAKATLENVTVSGNVYIKGGSIQMSGTYQEVNLATGLPIELTAGTIAKLVVSKAGSTLKVAPGASVAELVQKMPIQTENAVGGAGGAGGGANTNGGQVNAPSKLQSVTTLISGTAVELPVSDNTVLIDIPSLSESFSPSDTIDGFKIMATPEDAALISDSGKVQVGNLYTFQELENELGLIKEIAEEVGIPSSLVINQLLGGDQVTLGSLLDNYALGKQLASSLGYTLEDSYTFERTLTSSQGASETIYITLRLQS